MQGVRRVGGDVAAPQLLDQPVRGDHLAWVDQQDRKERPFPGSADVQPPAAFHDFQRPENPELHAQKISA